MSTYYLGGCFIEYDFLIDTYKTERMKTLRAWSTFKDEDIRYVQTRKTGGEETPLSTWCISV